MFILFPSLSCQTSSVLSELFCGPPQCFATVNVILFTSHKSVKASTIKFSKNSLENYVIYLILQPSTIRQTGSEHAMRGSLVIMCGDNFYQK